MQRITKESFEDATAFLLQGLEQRLSALEEISSNQESALKRIKKDRKLAHIITKPLLKEIAKEEPSAEESLSFGLREYIRLKYPEPCGYLKDQDIQYTLPRTGSQELLAKSKMNVVRLFSNSVRPKSVLKQATSFDDRRSLQESSPLILRTKFDLDREDLSPMKTEEDQTYEEKKPSVNRSEDRGKNVKHLSLKADPQSKWLASSKRILSSTNVLKGFRGNIRDFRDK